MTAVVYVVVALAAYRLTRVVTTDSISERARDRLYRWAWVEQNEPERYRIARERWHDDPPFSTDAAPMPRAGGMRTYVNELFNCPLCLGVWVSAGVYSAWRWLDYDWVRAVIAIFAVAGLQCFLATRENA